MSSMKKIILKRSYSIDKKNRQMSEYLFGIEEDEGLCTENVSASWNRSEVDNFLTQHGFINLRGKTAGERKD